MKRLLVLLSVLLMTGCGDNSSINCTKSQEEDYVILNQSMKVVFSDEDIKEAELTIDAVLKENYTSSKSYFTNLLQNQFASLESTYGVKPTIVETETGAKLTMPLKKEDFVTIYVTDGKINKDSIINKFEANGYTCK